MGADEKRSAKPLTDRIKERWRDFVEELVGTLEGMVLPPPVPIPVRPRR
jgi:hypothetical protein